MNIKTRKYKLEIKTYRKIAFTQVLISLWWAFLVPIAISLITIFVPSIWFGISAFILTVLYLLFWWIQFTGVGQLPQFKTLFERLSYEINSNQIMIKLNAKQGMPMPWNQIKSVKVKKDEFVLFINRFQIIHLPLRIFNSQNEINFFSALLKQKGFLKES